MLKYLSMIFILSLMVLFTYNCKNESSDSKIKQSIDSLKFMNDIDNNISFINNKLTEYKMKSIDLNESAEGGELKIYFSEENKLIKFSVIHFGETGKLYYDYYFNNNKIVFISDSLIQYSNPVNYQNIEISDVQTNKYYFLADKIFYWINNNKKVIDKDYTKKTSMLNKDVDELITKVKSIRN